MFALLSVLLLLSHVLPLVQSNTCDESTQYLKDGQCCKKCEPGQYMEKKCAAGSSDTLCHPCRNGFFTESYNLNYNRCNYCTMCTKDHMKYEKSCTLTSDATCTCEEGYRCSDSGTKCGMCVKVQTNITPHPPPAPPTSTKTALPTPDYMWNLVSLCLACVCVCVLLTCFLVISRHASCGWIMSASKDLCSYKKNNSEFSQEEQVPMPVQEVCGKTEKLEDV